MASDIFAKLGDIKGESQDDKHKDQIEVLSWSWGVTHHSAAGRPSFTDLSFIHRIDLASPLLMRACATGQHLREATITCRRSAGQPDFLVIKLSEVVVTSVAESDSGGDGGQTESVSLAFAKVDFEYRSRRADGTLGPGTSFTHTLSA